MQMFLAVGIGGALGAILRWTISTKFNSGEIPWGTWLVNIVGSFAIGALFIYFEQRQVPSYIQTGLLVGLLGGFTTFSAYSLEVVRLFEGGQLKFALIYAIGSMVLCVIAAFVGMAVAKSF